MYQYTAPLPAQSSALPAPALSSADIQAAHRDIQAARTLANITQRAARLWDDGYTVSEFRPGEFFVTSPLRPTATGSASDTYTVFCGERVGFSCTCPCFEKLKTCKHLLAVSAQVEEQSRENEWADREAARAAEYAEGRFVMEHSRY